MMLVDRAFISFYRAKHQNIFVHTPLLVPELSSVGLKVPVLSHFFSYIFFSVSKILLPNNSVLFKG